MITLLNPFWLITTDILLGIIVVVFFIVVVVLLIRDIALHAKFQHSKNVANNVRRIVSALGITMADGGEAIDKQGTPERKTPEKKKGEHHE